MAEGDGFVYDNFKEVVMEGAFNLASGGNAISVSLVDSDYVPNLETHVAWDSDTVSDEEYTTGLGYTAGGETLAAQDVTQDTDGGVFDANDVTWTSLGPLSPATPGFAVMWDSDATGELLIAYWELGTTATNGGNYTLSWAAAGIITLT